MKRVIRLDSIQIDARNEEVNEEEANRSDRAAGPSSPRRERAGRTRRPRGPTPRTDTTGRPHDETARASAERSRRSSARSDRAGEVQAKLHSESVDCIMCTLQSEQEIMYYAVPSKLLVCRIQRWTGPSVG